MPLHSPLAHRSSFSCSICNEFVELETARVDEFGQPVHEECYVQKISLKTSIRPTQGIECRKCPFTSHHQIFCY
jgi:hypothetical protein